MESQVLHAARSSHGMCGRSTLVLVKKVQRYWVGLSLPLELEPCAPKVKCKSLGTAWVSPELTTDWLASGASWC